MTPKKHKPPPDWKKKPLVNLTQGSVVIVNWALLAMIVTSTGWGVKIFFDIEHRVESAITSLDSLQRGMAEIKADVRNLVTSQHGQENGLTSLRVKMDANDTEMRRRIDGLESRVRELEAKR